MAASKPTTSFYKRSPRITRVLIYTFLEWTLIVLLLLNGLFSYLISKFASFFNLKPPCILCSRVDHLFEPDIPPRKSYRRFLCDSHKVEVSQLGFCSLHRRLAEAGDMCEDCGSSRPVPGGGGAVLSWMRRSEMGEKDLKCSCCGIALESGFYSPYFLSKPNWSVLDYTDKDDLAGKDAIFEVDQGRIVGFDVLDRISEREGDHREVFLDGDQKRITNDHYGDAILEPEEVRPLLPRNVAEDEVADKEFEIENSKNADSEVEKDNGLLIKFEEEPLIKLDDSIPDEIVGSSVIVPGNLDQNVVENGRMKSIELIDSIAQTDGCDVNQLCVEEREIGSDNGLSTIRDVDLLDIGVVFEEEKNIVSISEETMSGPVEQNSNALQEGIEETKEDLDVSIGSEIGEQEQVEPVLATATNDLISLSVNQTGDEQAEVKVKEQLESSLVSLLDLSSAQLDDSIKGLGQIEIERADSTIPILDNLLHIEDSDGHTGHNGNQSEDEQLPETPTHIANEEDMHLLQRRLIFNKTKLGPESADGLSLNSETDSTEPLTVEQLKSALQSERNALRAIYLELEEERSASAIAANQTMAMINRLQEEKAAMQMEALQYQRMMEEQSEYDQEALQMLNELVVKREKEKEELEKALEAYKHKVVALERKIGRGSDRSSGKRSGLETSSSSSSDSLEFSVALDNGNDEYVPAEGHLMSLESSLDEFEEERKSILEQLKGLEEKLFSLEGSSDDDEKRSINESQENENHCQDCELLSDVLHVPGNGSIKHNPQGKNSGYKGKRLLPLFDAVSLENGEETGEENGDDKITGRENPSIQEEITEVYERLQALEADREFIRHCIKSLKKGDAGLDLLSEILQHLRDLRRVELQDTNSGGIIASLTS